MGEANPRKSPLYAGDWSASAGQPYEPSNGTEGEFFMSLWCGGCKREAAYRADPDNAEPCMISLWAMAVHSDDPDYPKEWRRDDQGVPECTAWEAADARPEVRP